MKETFYFSHDYHARSDPKIVKLRQKEDWYWYGLYFAIIEMLYENDWYLERNYESIAFELRTECECIARIIEDYQLFNFEWEKIFSESVLKRLQQRKAKSKKATQSAQARWTKEKKGDANALRTECERNAIKERKGKERKEETLDVVIGEPPKKTPKQIAEEFFATAPEEIVSSLWVEPEHQEKVLREVRKFISYWTEPNKSGTKQLWQTKDTFEVSRRLRTWFDNAWQHSTSSQYKTHGHFTE